MELPPPTSDKLELDQVKKKKITPLKKKKAVNLTPVAVKEEVHIVAMLLPKTATATHLITYNQLYEFIVETFNKLYDQSFITAEKYTKNTASLVLMMEEAHTHTKNRFLKTRLTKMINSLCKNSSFENVTPPQMIEETTSDSDAQ